MLLPIRNSSLCNIFVSLFPTNPKPQTKLIIKALVNYNDNQCGGKGWIFIYIIGVACPRGVDLLFSDRLYSIKNLLIYGVCIYKSEKLKRLNYFQCDVLIIASLCGTVGNGNIASKMCMLVKEKRVCDFMNIFCVVF